MSKHKKISTPTIIQMILNEAGLPENKTNKHSMSRKQLVDVLAHMVNSKKEIERLLNA